MILKAQIYLYLSKAQRSLKRDKNEFGNPVVTLPFCLSSFHCRHIGIRLLFFTLVTFSCHMNCSRPSSFFPSQRCSSTLEPKESLRIGTVVKIGSKTNVMLSHDFFFHTACHCHCHHDLWDEIWCRK